MNEFTVLTDLRRSKRELDYLPAQVYASDGLDHRSLAGPFSGRIIDVSRHGACLLMSQVMINSFHIFYSVREDASLFLQLHLEIPPEDQEFFLTARPVWLDIYRKKEIRAFKMGIEFLLNPQGKQIQELQAALKEHQQERANWWKSRGIA